MTSTNCLNHFETANVNDCMLMVLYNNGFQPYVLRKTLTYLLEIYNNLAYLCKKKITIEVKVGIDIKRTCFYQSTIGEPQVI